MFRKINASLAGLMAGLLLALGSFAAPAVASAASSANPVQNNLSCGANLDASNIGGSGTSCPQTTSSGASSVSSLVTKSINILSLAIGIIAVVMLIFGGARYITSGGDSGKVTSAKNTIIYSVIGLVIVALAQFIVQFVLNQTNNAGSNNTTNSRTN